MRNLRKLIAGMLVVAMMITTLVPAVAQSDFSYETEAETLYELGLFKGESETEYVPNLGASLDRQSGVIMLLRMLGEEEEAMELDYADAAEMNSKFDDAHEISSWARKQVAYAVDKGYVRGLPDGTFRPLDNLKGNDVSSLFLQALGYDGYFEYHAATVQMQNINALTQRQAVDYATKNLTRNEIVGIFHGTLRANYNHSDLTVAQHLVNMEKVDGKRMSEIVPGTKPEPIPEVEVVSVEANSDGEVTVKLSENPEKEVEIENFRIFVKVSDHEAEKVEGELISYNEETHIADIQLARFEDKQHEYDVVVSVAYKNSEIVEAEIFTVVAGFSVTGIYATDVKGETVRIEGNEIAANSDIEIRFSRHLDLDRVIRGNITLRRENGVREEYDVNYEQKSEGKGSIVTLSPYSGMEPGDKYTLTLDTNRLRSYSNEYLSGEQKYEFVVSEKPVVIEMESRGGTDEHGQDVEDTKLVDGSVLGAPNSKIALFFNKDMNGATINQGTVRVRNVTDNRWESVHVILVRHGEVEIEHVDGEFGKDKKLDIILSKNIADLDGKTIGREIVYTLFSSGKVEITSARAGAHEYEDDDYDSVENVYNRIENFGGQVGFTFGARFDKAMDPSTMNTRNIVLRELETDIVIQTDVEYSVGAQYVTIKPKEDLKQDTQYRITFGNGIRTKEGLALEEVKYTFLTGVYEVPKLVSPDSEIDNLGLEDKIKLKFDREVEISSDKLDDYFALRNVSARKDVDLDLWTLEEVEDGKKFNLVPPSYEDGKGYLVPDSSYVLTLKSNIKDTTTNENALEETTVRFTTKAVGVAHLKNVTEDNHEGDKLESGVKSLAIDAELSFNFDSRLEGYNKTELKEKVELRRKSGNSWVTDANYTVELDNDDKSIVLKPDSEFEKVTEYRVTLRSTIRDIFGNSIQGSINFEFTTGPQREVDTARFKTNTDPECDDSVITNFDDLYSDVGRASDVSIGTHIVVNLSEEIGSDSNKKLRNITKTTVYLEKYNGDRVNADVKYKEDDIVKFFEDKYGLTNDEAKDLFEKLGDNAVIIVPVSELDAETRYVVVVDGVKDGVGNKVKYHEDLESTVVRRFTTEDNVAPEIKEALDENADDYDNDTEFTFTFSRAMNPVSADDVTVKEGETELTFGKDYIAELNSDSTKLTIRPNPSFIGEKLDIIISRDYEAKNGVKIGDDKTFQYVLDGDYVKAGIKSASYRERDGRGDILTIELETAIDGVDEDLVQGTADQADIDDVAAKFTFTGGSELDGGDIHSVSVEDGGKRIIIRLNDPANDTDIIIGTSVGLSSGAKDSRNENFNEDKVEIKPAN